MSLVFAGVCSHGPGITGRADMAPKEQRDAFYAAFDGQRDRIRAAGAEVLLIMAAEHFANFFMDNMPCFAMGMAESYDGPIEDPEWLKIPHRTIRGDPVLSKALIEEVQQTVDVAFAEEWRLDHGIMVPLHFLDPANEMTLVPVNINCQGPPLTPLHRAWAFGEALRRACDKAPQKIALLGTGGISHWPATPDSGKINREWDLEFLRRWAEGDKEAMLSYTNEETYRDGGQGGFEIRTFIAAAAAAGGRGTVHHYDPIPIFSVGCTIADLEIV